MREKGKPNWHECSLRHWITGKLDKSAPKVFAMLFNIFSLFNVIMLRSFGLTVHNERIFMAENRHQWQLYRDLCISFLRRMHVEITNSFFKMQICPFLSMRPPSFLAYEVADLNRAEHNATIIEPFVKWSTVAMVEYSLLRILPEEFSIVVFCFEHHYHYSAILFVFLFVFFFFFVTLAQNNTYLLSDKKVYLAIGKMNLVYNWSKKLLHENDANNFTPHSLSSHKSNEGKFSVPSWKKNTWKNKHLP